MMGVESWHRLVHSWGVVLRTLVWSASAVARQPRLWLTSVFMTGLSNGAFLLLWLSLYSGRHVLNGVPLKDFLVLFSVLAVGSGAVTTCTGRLFEIPVAFASGEMTVLASQPGPLLSRFLVSKVEPSGIGDIMFGLVILAAAEALGAEVHHGFWLVGVAVCAATYVSWIVLVSSLAVTDARFPAFAAQSLFTLGIFPGFALPDAYRVLLYTVVPTAFFAVLPARLALLSRLEDLLLLIAGVVALAVVAAVTWRRTLRQWFASRV